MAYSANLSLRHIRILLQILLIACIVVGSFFYDTMAVSAVTQSETASSTNSQAFQRTKPTMRFLDVVADSVMEASLFRTKSDKNSSIRIHHTQSLFSILLVFLYAMSLLLFLRNKGRIARNSMRCSSILALPIGGNSPPAVHA